MTTASHLTSSLFWLQSCQASLGFLGNHFWKVIFTLLMKGLSPVAPWNAPGWSACYSSNLALGFTTIKQKMSQASPKTKILSQSHSLQGSQRDVNFWERKHICQHFQRRLEYMEKNGFCTRQTLGQSLTAAKSRVNLDKKTALRFSLSSALTHQNAFNSSGPTPWPFYWVTMILR